MTIEKQKILRFIPIFQLITVFFWLRHYAVKQLPWSDFGRSMLKIFIVLLLIHIPRMIIYFIFKNDVLDNVLYCLSLYPTFWGIATIAVYDQERHELNS